MYFINNLNKKSKSLEVEVNLNNEWNVEMVLMDAALDADAVSLLARVGEGRHHGQVVVVQKTLYSQKTSFRNTLRNQVKHKQ